MGSVVTRPIAVYVELDVAMAYERGAAAWVFDLDLWGLCGQGEHESASLAALQQQIAAAGVGAGGIELSVVERVIGDEQAFSRDHQPGTEAERHVTLAALASERPRTAALVRSCTPAALDWDDPERVLPPYAQWRTLRQLAWHIADTESRYYLPRLGLGHRPRANDVLTELDESFAYTRHVVAEMPLDVVRKVGGDEWTSVKLLRRLAWHERGELDVMTELAARAKSHFSDA